MIEYENKDIDIDDYLDEGFILVRAIIEIAGSPKEFVEQLVNDLKTRLFLFQSKNFNPQQKIDKDTLEKINKAIEENKDFFEGKEEERSAVIANLFIKDVDKLENSPLYSAFIEAEVLLKDIKELFKFSTFFTPSSLQILEPTKIKVDNITLQEFLNEIVSVINITVNNLKNLEAENRLLKEELAKCRRLQTRFKK
jgi:hypothetical protein